MREKKRTEMKKKMSFADVMRFYLYPAEYLILDFLAYADFARMEEIQLATGIAKTTLKQRYIPELRRLGLIEKYEGRRKQGKATKKLLEMFYITRTGAIKRALRSANIEGILQTKGEQGLKEYAERLANYVPPPNPGTEPATNYRHRVLVGKTVAYLLRNGQHLAGNARTFAGLLKGYEGKIAFIPDLYGIVNYSIGEYSYEESGISRVEFYEVETNENDTKRIASKLKKYAKSFQSLKEFAVERLKPLYHTLNYNLIFVVEAEKRDKWLEKYKKALLQAGYASKQFLIPTRLLVIRKDFENSYEEAV